LERILIMAVGTGEFPPQPVPLVPEIKIKRHHPGRIAVGVAATAVAVAAGTGGYMAINRGGAPENTASPSPIVQPSNLPTPKESIVVTPIPTQSETTPSPTPEIIPNIENVPLAAEGGISVDSEFIHVYNGTITKIEKNPDGTVKDFVVTVAGNRITELVSPDSNKIRSYTGVSLKINIADLTQLGDENSAPAFKKIGAGTQDISRYIELGKAIPEVMLPIGKYSQDYPDVNKISTENKTTLNKLHTLAGETLSRQQSSDQLPFTPTGILVQP